MPNVRRLRLNVRSAGPTSSPEHDFDAAPLAPELHLQVKFRDVDHDAVGAALMGSELGKQLRSLHVEAGRPLGRLGTVALESLEELSVMPMGNVNLEVSDRLFQADGFPNVRTLSLAFPQQYSAVVESPLAGRVETLSIPLGHAGTVKAWLNIRERFPKLRTLVARGWRSLPAAMRGALLDDGYEVVWPEPEPWARNRYFGNPGGAPGFVGMF